jgi:hypothetical protein
MAKKYYTLAVRWSATDAWSPEFGDYSRTVVKDEQADMRDGSNPPHASKIISSGDTQAEINAAIAALNGAAAPARYSAVAVQRQIDRDPRIGPKEARAIHALLKGRH